ncbi:MAG: hypothetical protein MRY63_13650 [Neomegalonema sp.]|nr:hypothetical protein [Neomegalonema sp.]
MIGLHEVDFAVRANNRYLPLLAGENFSFDAPRMAILSDDDKTRTALIWLLCGRLHPQHGRVLRKGLVSWPIGTAAPFRANTTGDRGIRMICDLYGLRFGPARDFMAHMLDEPDQLSHNMLAWPRDVTLQFSYAISLLPRFDIYVLDGSLRFAMAEFTARWQGAFAERVANKQLIISTTQTRDLIKIEPVAVTPIAGRLALVDDILSFSDNASPSAPQPIEEPTDDLEHSELF